MLKRSGHCHCQRIRFEATTDLACPFRCNCSFCERRGATLHKLPLEAFSLLVVETSLSSYGSRDFSTHYFCPNCGIHCFTRITRPNEASIVVNLACLEGVDLTALSPSVFDGKNRL